jgi:outer membrane protein assembly factor BamA
MAAAAQSYSVRYLSGNERSLHLKSNFSNREAATKYIQQLPSLLLAKGYLAASVDSVDYDSTEAVVSLYTGGQYYWGHVQIPPGYQAILGRANSEKKWQGKLLAGGQVEIWQQQLLDYFSSKGHPFASVGLDSVMLSGDSLYGKMIIDEGPLYKIDSIHISGKVKLKPSFIYPYLHIKKGMPYQQALLDKIDQRLNELPFAESSQPWQLDMLGSGSIVNVYLQPKRSNIINALIGIAPSSTQTPGNKLLLSGEANILLRNAFSSGETIGINWQQLQYKSPRLNLLYQQPYIFNSQAGIDFAFELFKKDTQYVNINLRIGVPYDFTGSRTGKVFFQQLNTNVTYVDTNEVIASRTLPDLADVSSSNLGLEYQWNTADYRFNPRRGVDLFLSGTGGLKTIKENSTIAQLKDPQEPAYNFGSLYDTVKMKTYQLRLRVKGAKYIPAGRRTVLKLALDGGWYQSQNYYRNELFQIGGSKVLRGFDEESIFARSYAVGTVEFRYLTGRNSYFFAFSDGGYASYKDQSTSYGHSYIGCGLGLALETKNSLVNLSWAVGKRNDLSFDIRQSKIHIGFVNYF